MRRVVVGSLVLCVGAAVPALAAPGDQRSHNTVAVREAFTAADISLDAGDVVIRHGATRSVEITKQWNGKEPTVSVKVSGGVLHISGECAPFLGTPVVTVYAPSSCSTSIVLTVPTSVLDSTVGSYGNVSLNDLGGRQVLRSGSGNLAVSRTSGGTLQLDTNGGNVTLLAVRGANLQANSGSGTVQVTDAAMATDVTLSPNGGDVSAPEVSARSIALSAGPGVREIVHLRTQHIGPEEILVAAKIEFDAELTFEQLSESIDATEALVRAATPAARMIYIDPGRRAPAL